ncbi:MAG: pyridoxamine 5'-phosphate oxidase family protein [Anaerolineae bacterium]
MNLPQRMRPNMAAGYGISKADEGLMEWSWADEQLKQSKNYWICSTRPDGRPHAAPVWGAWHDGALYFGSDRQAVKARNLAANPQVVMHLESGDDVVIVEGTVREYKFGSELGEQALLETLAADLTRKYPAFPQTPDEMRKNMLLVLKPSSALAWLEKSYPNTATKFVFNEA